MEVQQYNLKSDIGVKHGRDFHASEKALTTGRGRLFKRKEEHSKWHKITTMKEMGRGKFRT